MKKHTRNASVLGRAMDFAVSGYVYFVAFTLVVYMIGTLVTGVYDMLLNVATLSTQPSFDIASSVSRTTLELGLLHTIAFTIVLVKAYKILISYAETQHINLKFLVEIAIIAPTIELLFNSQSYALSVNIVFAAFALCNLMLYLYFYKLLKKVSDDYERENC